MNKMKRPLLVIVAMLLVCAMSAAATLALYHAITKELKNTFTFGSVDVKLDESDPDNPGKRTEEGVNYDVDPGRTYVKDPVMHNTSKTEAAWVRMAVTLNGKVEKEFNTDLASFVVGEDKKSTLDLAKWEFVTTYKNGDDTVYVYDYKNPDKDGNPQPLAAGDSTSALFTHFTIPATWDPAAKDSVITRGINFITVQGYAIQASGIEYADVAATMADVWDDVFPAVANPDTSVTPEDTSATPEDTSATPEDTSVTPEDTSATPEDTSATPEDTSATPEDTSATPEDTSATPEDTSATPEDTSATPEDTSATPEDTSATPNT